MRAPRFSSLPYRSSPVHRLPAWLKFGSTVAGVLAISLWPRPWGLWLALPGVLLLGVLTAARLPPFAVFRRLLLLEPFVLGVALLALLSPPPQGGTGAFLFLLARSSVALLALVLFAATTPFTELLALLRTLRVPFLLVTTLALMHRYLFVLADESGRMRRARQCRSFSPRRRVAWATLSSVIAQLFLRASERADRIYDAMRARGWDAKSHGET